MIHNSANLVFTLCLLAFVLWSTFGIISNARKEKRRERHWRQESINHFKSYH